MPSLYYRTKLSYLWARMADRSRLYGFVYAKHDRIAIKRKSDYYPYNEVVTGHVNTITRGWMEARPVRGANGLYACFACKDTTHDRVFVRPWRECESAQVIRNGKSAFTKEEAQALICEHETFLAKLGFGIVIAQPFSGLLRDEPKLLPPPRPLA